MASRSGQRHVCKLLLRSRTVTSTHRGSCRRGRRIRLERTTVLQNFLGAAAHIWNLLWCQAARPGSLFRPAQRAAPNRGREDLGIFHLRDQLRPQKFRGAAQEQQAFTWDQSSGRSDHVSGPYIARDLGKFLCIGQFPAKIKSASEAEYLAQRHALIAQAPGHARLHTITHDLGAPSSANVCGREKKNPPRNWRGLIPSRRPRWLSGEIFVRSGSWFRAQFGWIAVDVR